MGAGGRSGRELQTTRTVGAAVSQGRRDRREGRGDRLLPYRRTVEPHLVRAQVPPGRDAGAQLRRLVDRVGQSRRGSDREGGTSVTATGSRTLGPSDRTSTKEPALWALVGNTPLLSVRLSEGPTVRLKCEWVNPGGRVKDRPALFMLREGVARGELPGKRLLDASSGNTAIAYAMLGAAAGIGVTVCWPANASRERQPPLRPHPPHPTPPPPLPGPPPPHRPP